MTTKSKSQAQPKQADRPMFAPLFTPKPQDKPKPKTKKGAK
jgi:hypothetical protein